MQAAEVSQLFDGEKILLKSSTFLVRRNNVTDRQTEDRLTDMRRHKANLTQWRSPNDTLLLHRTLTSSLTGFLE